MSDENVIVVLTREDACAVEALLVRELTEWRALDRPGQIAVHERRLAVIRAALSGGGTEGDGPEPGEPIAEVTCPCCGAALEIEHGDDEKEVAVIGTPALTDALAEERSDSGEPVAGNQIRIGVALGEIEDSMDHFADQPLVLDRMSWTRTVREILEALVAAVLPPVALPVVATREEAVTQKTVCQHCQRVTIVRVGEPR